MAGDPDGVRSKFNKFRGTLGLKSGVGAGHREIDPCTVRSHVGGGWGVYCTVRSMSGGGVPAWRG